MARNNPVKICVIRQIPRTDPKFHHEEMLEGVGKSIRELFIILMIGWVFRKVIIIFVTF